MELTFAHNSDGLVKHRVETDIRVLGHSCLDLGVIELRNQLRNVICECDVVRKVCIDKDFALESVRHAKIACLKGTRSIPYTREASLLRTHPVELTP